MSTTITLLYALSVTTKKKTCLIFLFSWLVSLTNMNRSFGIFLAVLAVICFGCCLAQQPAPAPGGGDPLSAIGEIHLNNTFPEEPDNANGWFGYVGVRFSSLVAKDQFLKFVFSTLVSALPSLSSLAPSSLCSCGSSAAATSALFPYSGIPSHCLIFVKVWQLPS